MHVNPSANSEKYIAKVRTPISFLVGDPESIPHVSHHYTPPASQRFRTVNETLLKACIANAAELGFIPGAVVLRVDIARNRNMAVSPWQWGIITNYKRIELEDETRCIAVTWMTSQQGHSRERAHTAAELVLVYPKPESEDTTHSYILAQLDERKLK